MFRKFLAAAAAVIISASAFTGCGSGAVADDGKLNVVCTVFPLYDWAREVVGDAEDVRLTYLLGSGADIHSFQPTADDMIAISDCDVFIYVGGESDKWIDDALKNAKNRDMTVINMMDFLGSSIVEEELKEGMEAESDSDEEPEYDEHIWLSLNLAERCVRETADVLGRVDPENSAKYRENCDRYTGDLQLLDRSFHLLFDQSPQTLIFGDRFPFRYLLDDYGLDYYAAFSGCSADNEASFETITFLSQKADELGAETIFAIENSDCTIADAVIANTSSRSQKIAVLDSIQSVTQKQIDEGRTYLGAMKNNYDVLKEAFK